jgi:carbon monoxide dehydrogenase subunit G
MNYRRLIKTTRGVYGGILLKIGGLAAVALAASSALSDTTDETTLSSVSFTAHELSDGTVIEFEAQGVATATNGTDTLTVKVKLGSTVIASTGAVDVANNDIWHLRGRIVIRTDGATGTLVATGTQILGAEGATVKSFKLASTAVDTTGALTLAVTGTWSVASASNSCRNDVFVVRLEGGDGAPAVG